MMSPLAHALDPDLLTTPFAIETNWHVITGAPSCGKTTLIDLFAKNGFKTAPEGARIYIEHQVAAGRTIDEIRADMPALQRGIKDMQLVIERGLPPEDCIFLDRTVHDSLAWYRIFDLDPNECLGQCFRHRYASVFILDQLPLSLDGFRFNDEGIADFLDQWHVRDYIALGYQIERVPVLPPGERLNFVIEKLTELGLTLESS
jgi:predicted ATPase